MKEGIYSYYNRAWERRAALSFTSSDVPFALVRVSFEYHGSYLALSLVDRTRADNVTYSAPFVKEGRLEVDGKHQLHL